jgi:hypothetical protein
MKRALVLADPCSTSTFLMSLSFWFLLQKEEKSKIENGEVLAAQVQRREAEESGK